MEQKHLKIGLLGFGSMGKAQAYAIQNLRFFYQNLPFSAEILAKRRISFPKGADRLVERTRRKLLQFLEFHLKRNRNKSKL